MAYDYPKYGSPRSELERRRRHKRLHPGTKLPKRGSDKREYVADAIRERKSA